MTRSTRLLVRSLRAGRSTRLLAVVLPLMVAFGHRTAAGDTAALRLRATIAGAATRGTLTITLSRWSTDAERAPLLKALSPPVTNGEPKVRLKPDTADTPVPAPAAPAASGGRAGSPGARGRGAPPPLPPTPFARLSAAIRAGPTLGYIWTDGVTGYSIKYAWRSPAPVQRDEKDEKERIVLITARRINSHAPGWAAASAAADADFTVIEMHLDAHGAGEAKTSLTSGVAIDTTANTLALDDYAAAPALLKVTR
jgi:hypothetical protein